METSTAAIRFELLAEDRASAARRGRLTTPHGTVETPAFMPVGTQGTVKGLTPAEVREAGAGMILANTFHLYLRPGAGVVARAGGLHAFMGWDGPLLTDSGGYQVFSLSRLRRLDDDGVTFRSPADGSSHRFTPETVIAIQNALGADVVMPLDVPLGYPADARAARRALDITLRWLDRSIAAGPSGALFGIIQGGFDERLRAEAAERTAGRDLPGYAIGGLSVGEPAAATAALLRVVAGRLPADRPRYAMGLGSPRALLDAVAGGADLFDCALPTRIGRTGTLLAWRGRLNIRNARFRDDLAPPDPDCDCAVCRTTTRAYLRHLFAAGEMLGPRLASYHNLSMLGRLMREARGALAAGRFDAWRRGYLAGYEAAW